MQWRVFAELAVRYQYQLRRDGRLFIVCVRNSISFINFSALSLYSIDIWKPRCVSTSQRRVDPTRETTLLAMHTIIENSPA